MRFIDRARVWVEEAAGGAETVAEMTARFARAWQEAIAQEAPDFGEPEKRFLALDLALNAQGLAVAADAKRRVGAARGDVSASAPRGPPGRAGPSACRSRHRRPGLRRRVRPYSHSRAQIESSVDQACLVLCHLPMAKLLIPTAGAVTGGDQSRVAL